MTRAATPTDLALRAAADTVLNVFSTARDNGPDGHWSEDAEREALDRAAAGAAAHLAPVMADAALRYRVARALATAAHVDAVTAEWGPF